MEENSQADKNIKSEEEQKNTGVEERHCLYPVPFIGLQSIPSLTSYQNMFVPV